MILVKISTLMRMQGFQMNIHINDNSFALLWCLRRRELPSEKKMKMWMFAVARKPNKNGKGGFVFFVFCFALWVVGVLLYVIEFNERPSWVLPLRTMMGRIREFDYQWLAHGRIFNEGQMTRYSTSNWLRFRCWFRCRREKSEKNMGSVPQWQLSLC